MTKKTSAVDCMRCLLLGKKEGLAGSRDNFHSLNEKSFKVKGKIPEMTKII